MGILAVPCTKGKTTIDIDTDKVPEEVYREALLQGFKVLMNRGTSKITKEAYPNEEEMKAAAVAKANEQVEAIYQGTIKITGQKAKKASGAVMTEARRIAKGYVKDQMRAAKLRISDYKASEITKAAEAMLADSTNGPAIVAQAEEVLKSRAAQAVTIDLSAIIHADPGLVAKREATKASRKTQLSAAKAGKPKVRAKPTAEVHAH